MPKPGYSGKGSPIHKGGRMSRAKEMKSGGTKATRAQGKVISVDHGPRATGASPAGSGRTGFPGFSRVGKKSRDRG